MTSDHPIIAEDTGSDPAPAADSATTALAEWAATLTKEPATLEIQDTVRNRLLDYCANLLGGAEAPSATLLSRYAREFPGDVPLPDGHAVAPESSALVFGAASHAIESDDTHQPSSSHPGTVIFSTVLSMAFADEAEWDAVVAASVAGYEVMCRIGEVSGPAAEYRRGFHPTGTVGVFGAATAAGLLLGSAPEEIIAAMGIAGSLSSGSMSFLTSGAWTKHLHPGWAAHSGIAAARLAEAGFRGPDAVLEPPHGYFAGHSDTGEPGQVALGLGDRPFVIERTSTKAHGCCRYEQAALDGVLALRAANDLAADDVHEIRIGVLEAGWNIVAEPIDHKRRPMSAVEAQFSMPFGAAVAMLHGRASVHEHTDELARDPRVRDLMDRVQCVRDPSLDADYPEKWPATVEIRLEDGRSYATRVDYPKGDPENPLTTLELEQKFHDLARRHPERRRDAVVEAIQNLSSGRTLDDLRGTLVSAWGSHDVTRN